ncbi:Processing alpha glucosidase I [Tulasnella sp. 403]|nr:Processing alpha glucosidase I [Tulasnella sp. 403]
MTGLVWFGLSDYQSFSQIRHSCEQGDGLAGYTWTEHDPREGGIQVLKDPKNNLEIVTELLKFPGGNHGGSWAARIKGRPIDEKRPSKTSVVFYLGLEGLGDVHMDTAGSKNGIESDTTSFSGSSLDLGDFKLRIVDDAIKNGPGFDELKHRGGVTHFFAQEIPDGNIITNAIVTQAQAIVERFKDRGLPFPSLVLTLPDEKPPKANFYAIQKMVEGEFSFDVYFESGSAGHQLSPGQLTTGVETFKAKFENRFQQTFPLPPNSSPAFRKFSQAITSNLFGGIGYFYGTSVVDGSAVDRQDEDEDEDEDEDDYVDDGEIKRKAKLTYAPARELLTGTPSRPFFPRGFYWDEGFHLLLIGAWDNDLSLEILKSWVDLIDENGWVGREQILGEEARSKVPEEFQMQFPTYANPPTLTMAVTSFISRLKKKGATDSLADQMGFQQTTFTDGGGHVPDNTVTLLEPEAARQYLRSIYPALRRHYDWFRRTQRGQIKQWSGRQARSRNEAYRWRGRSEQHVLTSGLDDYPRAAPHVGELHVDLISWVGFFSRTMREIAEFLGEREDEEELRGIENDIIMNIDDLHWSEENKMYCDASVDDDGYVSLFPFLLQLLPADSPHLKHILEMIRDPQILWSPWGIRSLSASHPQFGAGENYWKGPIWIQMNYLALKALWDVYAAEPGPYQDMAKEIYQELRQNIIDNVFKEYERTGYVWEQYDALTGEGRRSHPFTGWTSLVTMIISEQY